LSNLHFTSLLRGKGLELRSALQLRGKAEAKELPSPPPFFLTIPQPLRREKLLHYVQVKFDAIASRVLNLHFQGAGLDGSNLQIWLLKIKAKYREMIFRVLKQN